MSKWDNDNDWFFDKFDRESKSMFKRFGKMAVLITILNIVFWVAIIAAIVVGLAIVL